ncbi:carboxypeptidase-like regulatory domain-containing protein [Labilibaculum sp.]|uniref:carboxypeptidase-like regulatory domain-containing protein n=1 Tax=Labilibaculum sp. TaxID=2060723 RepID=UPI002AA83402|nr:carboxypeptidase-like regulatory domain-containing protein [Labilibaculum sp.]MBN2597348.1 carboxypeptidase-like regulatory domain-containing protein [Marinifilaceae bacterium]
MKLKRVLYISLILIFSSPYYSFSESSKIDTIISISGQILHSESLTPIPLATISIKRTRKGIICDSLGIFHLQIQQYDTLRISALGYKAIDWEVPFVFNPDSPPFFQIKLEDISYLLDEVDIYALGTWDEFKEDFVKTKLEEKDPINKSIMKQLAPYNTKEPNIVPAQYRPKNEGKMGVLGAIFAPTDFLYSKLSKSEKSKKELSKIIRNEGKAKKISSKYNADIVADATGLEGDELLKFMEYAGSEIKVSPNSSEYYVMQQILFLFKKYQEETTEAE